MVPDTEVWSHEHEWTLDAPPSRVFAALTVPRELTQWFAEFAEVEPQAGGVYRFWGRHTLDPREKAAARQQIVDILHDERLAFTWCVAGVDTMVTISLTPADSGTRLQLRHVHADLGVPRQREMIDDHWRLAIANLMAFLGDRRGLLMPDYTDPLPVVRHEMHIDAPRNVVWRTLIEPELVNRWFGTDTAIVDPREGGTYSVGWKYRVDDREVTGGPTHILDLVGDERLVLDWPDWRGDESVPPQRIAFELEDDGSGSLLKFWHSDFERTTDISDFAMGWLYFLDELKSTAETVAKM